VENITQKNKHIHPYIQSIKRNISSRFF